MGNRETTILVTDSGLGGLSVFSGMAGALAKDGRYDRVSLIYFNAWPSQNKGYNHYPDREARAKVFHNAMDAMAGFAPDHIYIACNTLSVIYPFTRFAKETSIPVTGIVDHGVDMIHRELVRDDQSRVVIFGTPTTVQENTHKTALIQKGIHPDRIITRGCLNLAGKIERDPFGDEIGAMIDENARAAAAQLGKCSGKVFAALCCTHFGYCREKFHAALARHTGTGIGILNPNEEMVAGACDTGGSPGQPEIRMRIFSRVTWEPSRINAYDRLLTPVSPASVDALKHYTLDRDLFSIDID
ncbi:MAG: aspartate/glutamate racemase family protein [Desulfobacterales bacterium]|nr:aspartate/glutamate racemase family protein [Desulfobacterales bacterium]